MAPPLSNQVSAIVRRAIGAGDVFLTLIVVVTTSPLRLVTGCKKSTSACPLIGGSTLRLASIDLNSGALGVCASRGVPATVAAASAATIAKRARFINPPPDFLGLKGRDYTLHLAVPILRLGVGRSEDFHMPFAPAPRLDDLGGHHIHQDLGEDATLGIALEVIGRLVPAEVRIEHEREKQVVPVVDDDQLATGALERRVIDQVFLGAVRADVTLQRKFAGDDFFDGDLLVPAVATVLLLALGLGDILGAAKGTPRLGDRLAGHVVNLPFTIRIGKWIGRNTRASGISH